MKTKATDVELWLEKLRVVLQAILAAAVVPSPHEPPSPLRGRPMPVPHRHEPSFRPVALTERPATAVVLLFALLAPLMIVSTPSRGPRPSAKLVPLTCRRAEPLAVPLRLAAGLLAKTLGLTAPLPDSFPSLCAAEAFPTPWPNLAWRWANGQPCERKTTPTVALKKELCAPTVQPSSLEELCQATTMWHPCIAVATRSKIMTEADPYMGLSTVANASRVERPSVAALPCDRR